MDNAHVIDQIDAERVQAPVTRRPLIRALEERLERSIVIYFTSFNYPTYVDDSDADMLESAVSTMNCSNGITLVLNSPGGDALAAERIVHIFRTYSGGDFEVLVPRAAKSAATMVSLGAKKIWMAETAELGPIDPQVPRRVGDQWMFLPAHAVVASYDRLIAEARSLTESERIEPYLQQLQVYDASEIEYLRSQQNLSKDIAFRTLKSGMMSGEDDSKVNSAVTELVDHGVSMSHGWSEPPKANRFQSQLF